MTFIFENDVNVPSKSKKQKKIRKIKFLLQSPESDLEPDSDPLVRGTDPQIRIRTKMSRNRNTV
jgi:hypothetical protein